MVIKPELNILPNSHDFEQHLERHLSKAWLKKEKMMAISTMYFLLPCFQAFQRQIHQFSQT